MKTHAATTAAIILGAFFFSCISVDCAFLFSLTIGATFTIIKTIVIRTTTNVEIALILGLTRFDIV